MWFACEDCNTSNAPPPLFPLDWLILVVLGQNLPLAHFSTHKFFAFSTILFNGFRIQKRYEAFLVFFLHKIFFFWVQINSQKGSKMLLTPLLICYLSSQTHVVRLAKPSRHKFGAYTQPRVALKAKVRPVAMTEVYPLILPIWYNIY